MLDEAIKRRLASARKSMKAAKASGWYVVANPGAGCVLGVPVSAYELMWLEQLREEQDLPSVQAAAALVIRQALQIAADE